METITAVCTAIAALLGGGGLGALITKLYKDRRAAAREDAKLSIKQERDKQALAQGEVQFIINHWREISAELHAKVEKLQQAHLASEIALAEARTKNHELLVRCDEQAARIEELQGDQS